MPQNIYVYTLTSYPWCTKILVIFFHFRYTKCGKLTVAPLQMPQCMLRALEVCVSAQKPQLRKLTALPSSCSVTQSGSEAVIVIQPVSIPVSVPTDRQKQSPSFI